MTYIYQQKEHVKEREREYKRHKIRIDNIKGNPG
jgi:hypothetical protein